MRIGIDLNTSEVQAAIRSHRTLVASRAAEALNGTAQAVQAAEVAEIQKTFFQPTRWILNSTVIEWARRDNLNAKVTFRDLRGGFINRVRPSAALQVQVDGGVRGQKRSEVRLSWLGGQTIYMIPGRFAEKDANGNPSRGELAKILSILGVLNRGDNRASRKGKPRARQRRKAPEYFVVLGKGDVLDRSGNALAPGIYRKGAMDRPLPVYVFTRGPPRYRPRLRWWETAKQAGTAAAPKAWQAAWAGAGRSAGGRAG